MTKLSARLNDGIGSAHITFSGILEGHRTKKISKRAAMSVNSVEAVLIPSTLSLSQASIPELSHRGRGTAVNSAAGARPAAWRGLNRFAKTGAQQARIREV
jgi:hypothetical protein